MDRYATHLPTIQKLFYEETITSVFEFGCGMYSTPYFTSHRSVTVTSIEMQSYEWYNRVYDMIGMRKNLNLMCMVGPNSAINYFRSIDTTYDLVLVDGHGDTRWNCINSAFSRSKFIIAHDVETGSYNWDNVILPSGWAYEDNTQFNPHTRTYYKINEV